MYNGILSFNEDDDLDDFFADVNSAGCDETKNLLF